MQQYCPTMEKMQQYRPQNPTVTLTQTRNSPNNPKTTPKPRIPVPGEHKTPGGIRNETYVKVDSNRKRGTPSTHPKPEVGSVSQCNSPNPTPAVGVGGMHRMLLVRQRDPFESGPMSGHSRSRPLCSPLLATLVSFLFLLRVRCVIISLSLSFSSGDLPSTPISKTQASRRVENRPNLEFYDTFLLSAFKPLYI